MIGSILAFSTGYLGCLLELAPDYITDCSLRFSSKGLLVFLISQG